MPVEIGNLARFEYRVIFCDAMQFFFRAVSTEV